MKNILLNQEIEKSIEAEIIESRRHVHKHAELSENEYETVKYICQKLDGWGIPYVSGVADTGVVAVIKGKGEGKCVGVRADIDALPIEEETGLEFSSVNPGAMHACGHDAHCAVLLGVAHAMQMMKDEFDGTVKLFFQPAEETIGGAKRMIADGCLEGPDVDYVLGLHVEPTLKTGQVGIKYGKMYAASDMLDVTIKGKGCHGAHPDEGVDAIIAAAGILNGIQTAVSRNVSPLNSAVCSFGRIEGGTVRNQIADRVTMNGIIRTLDPETRLFVREKVVSICKTIGEAYGTEVEVKVMESYGSLINNDDVTKIVEKNAAELVGEENVILEKEPDLGCEDFSYFAAAKPSCFFHLGCHHEKLGDRQDLHNSKFTVDEDCMITGVKLQVKNILDLLNK